MLSSSVLSRLSAGGFRSSSRGISTSKISAQLSDNSMRFMDRKVKKPVVPAPAASLSLELPSTYASIIHKTRYARFVDQLGRRETWGETVNRTIHALCAGVEMDKSTFEVLESAMLQRKVMPSMRVVMTAGPALDREHMCAYNCSFLPIDSVGAFAELLYILSCGSGVGFSVERKNVEKLPSVANSIRPASWTLQVQDSGTSWAISLRSYMHALFRGEMPHVDYSLIRPEGSRLMTMGGRASGPEPLKRALEFITKKFIGAMGRKLTPIEVHDIVCVIASCIVSGGVRRSALISLSDFDDNDMRSAKSGEWWKDHAYRAYANNSAVYEGRPSEEQFWQEWKALVASRSGERGIFNREAARAQALKTGRRKADGVDFGLNPCGEIFLRPRQTCNLSEVIVEPHDTWTTLEDKVRIAAIYGTLQSRFTSFNEEVLHPDWKRNNEEERLLGVSFTGLTDNPLTWNMTEELRSGLEHLKNKVLQTNRLWADRLRIQHSTATTCVKPSGTVSQVCETASGIHARWSPRQIRRLRMSKTDPVVKFLQKYLGAAMEDDVYNPSQVVFSYPLRAPDHALTVTSGEYEEKVLHENWTGNLTPEQILKDHGGVLPLPADDNNNKSDATRFVRAISRNRAQLVERRRQPHHSLSPLEQLELWKIYKTHWCEHNPSISIYPEDHSESWKQVGQWVWDNFDIVGGMSFFPRDLGTYKQCPNEAINKEHYERLMAQINEALQGKSLDWEKLREFETADNRPALSNIDNFACTAAGGCEL